MNISNPFKSQFRQNNDFSMYFALYLKIKNDDFMGGLWWTVTYGEAFCLICKHTQQEQVFTEPYVVVKI